MAALSGDDHRVSLHLNHRKHLALVGISLAQLLRLALSVAPCHPARDRVGNGTNLLQLVEERDGYLSDNMLLQVIVNHRCKPLIPSLLPQ